MSEPVDYKYMRNTKPSDLVNVSKDKILEQLRAAESLLGSTVVETPAFMISGRRRWLKETREILRASKIEPENLPGYWHEPTK